MLTAAKKIRTLLVQFQNDLQPWQINAFRGAIIEKVGRENILFNHHISDNTYLYRYPLIQYKSIRNQPAILCLGEGVDEIHKFFIKKDWTVNLHGRDYKLSIDKLDLNSITLNIWDNSYTYKIFGWLALNGKNYPAYQKITAPTDKTAFLRGILTANILSFAKGVDWRIQKKVELSIDSISRERPIQFKEVGLHAVDALFSTNVYLPDYIGLGKGASHGYGMIKQIRKNNNAE